MGEFGQDAGLHLYSFSKDILGFLMTTESQELGLTSHPKDGAFWQYCNVYRQELNSTSHQKGGGGS